VTSGVGTVDGVGSGGVLGVMLNARAFEWILGSVYALLGPTVWGFYLFLLCKGRQRMLLISHPARSLPENLPGVTILIPAKDEEARIHDCVGSALRQDYPRFDVIAIDDRSADATGKVLDEIAATNPMLKVLHVATENPPEGWTGKNNALRAGVEHATGDWMLFVDSDVILSPGALRATLAECLARQFDMMSLVLKLDSRGFWEGLLVPLAAGAVGTMYFMALTNSNDWPKVAFGNGQFILIKRDVYESVGGHSAVKDKFCEDMAMARLLKRNGYRPRIAVGTDLAEVRMYSSLRSIVRGWSRIFFASSDDSLIRNILAIFFLLFWGFTCYVAIGWGVYRNYHPASFVGGWLWLATGVIHLGIMLFGIGMMYHWTGNRRRNAWLFPLAGAMLMVILCRAIRQNLTGKVTWRGTTYSPAKSAGVLK